MKVQTTTNTATITYDNSESEFVATLTNEQKRMIRMGLVTVYDLGYKQNTTGRV